jgi:hypothetical protein
LANGEVAGVTTRGADISGTYALDVSRRMICYDLELHLPANCVAVTGMATGDEPRTIRVRGEAAVSYQAGGRFSCCVAGRAVDVALRRVGSLDDMDQFPGDTSRWHEPFFSATSSAPTAFVERS